MMRSILKHKTTRPFALALFTLASFALCMPNALYAKTNPELILLEQQLHDIREDAMALAREIRQAEGDIRRDNREIERLQQRESDLQLAVKAQEAELSTLLHAMTRYQRASAFVINPKSSASDHANELPRQHVVINTMRRTLQEKTLKLRTELQDIAANRTQLGNAQMRLSDKRERLDERQSELAIILAKRQKQYARKWRSNKNRDAALAKLTREASSVAALIDSLARTHEVDYATVSSPEAAKTSRASRRFLRRLRPIAPMRGKLDLPAQGSIIHTFNEVKNGKERYQGIVIATGNSAYAYAPHEGDVVYAGDFRDYGQLVILRHSDRYYTLIGGMKKTHVRNGQRIASGEPIGTLTIGSNAKLYLELRHADKAIDPLPWIKESTTVLASSG